MNLALFDLDNTLLNGDSDHTWGSFLCAQGAVDVAAYQAQNDAFYAQYQNGTLDNAAFLRFVLAPLASIPREQLFSLRCEFMRTHIAAMFLPKAQALVDQHLAAGDLVAIVTATNAFVTGPIARLYGVTNLIATIPAQENGQFTGQARGTPAFQVGKIQRVNDWLEGLALNLKDFPKSWFYSDSRNDLPLLQQVTHPVAVDPDDVLRAHAEQAGWAVLSLR